MTPSDTKTILLDFTQDMSGAEPRPEIVTDISENRNVSPAPVDSLYRHKLAFVAAIPVLVAITLLCIVGICYCQSTLSATPTSATSDYSELTGECTTFPLSVMSSSDVYNMIAHDPMIACTLVANNNEVYNT